MSCSPSSQPEALHESLYACTSSVPPSHIMISDLKRTWCSTDEARQSPARKGATDREELVPLRTHVFHVASVKCEEQTDDSCHTHIDELVQAQSALLGTGGQNATTTTTKRTNSCVMPRMTVKTKARRRRRRVMRTPRLALAAPTRPLRPPWLQEGERHG